MNVALDYDGVISANWDHYFQLAFDLVRSGHVVHIITAANPKRIHEVHEFLMAHFIKSPNVVVHCRPLDFEPTQKNIGEWKKKVLKENNIDMWFDNEVKNYEREGVGFSDIKAAIVRV